MIGIVKRTNKEYTIKRLNKYPKNKMGDITKKPKSGEKQYKKHHKNIENK